MRRAVLGLVLVFGLGLFAFSQAESSASSFVSSGKPVRATVGTFVFEQGQAMALELVRGEETCPCLCGEILIKGFKVVDAEGKTVYEDPGPYPVSAESWLGRWDLSDGEGAAVPPGDYTAVVSASIGEFRAQLAVVPRGERPAGISSARASVCGVELRVYRLVNEDDNGAEVVLRPGERLLVALPGNPTTGYEWQADEEPDFLERLAGVDYLRKAGAPPVGGGGTFLFRYRAESEGTGTLHFSYRRPWEEGAPAEEFSLTVIVGK